MRDPWRRSMTRYNKSLVVISNYLKANLVQHFAKETFERPLSRPHNSQDDSTPPLCNSGHTNPWPLAIGPSVLMGSSIHGLRATVQQRPMIRSVDRLVASFHLQRLQRARWWCTMKRPMYSPFVSGLQTDSVAPWAYIQNALSCSAFWIHGSRTRTTATLAQLPPWGWNRRPVRRAKSAGELRKCLEVISRRKLSDSGTAPLRHSTLVWSVDDNSATMLQAAYHYRPRVGGGPHY